MKGLCRIALAALFVAACSGDSGINEPIARRTLSQPPSMTGGMHALGVDSVTGASIETNQDDYVPGEVVHVVGRGWAAGETVNLHMTEAPDTHADVDTNVVADASGSFSIHYYSVTPYDLGVTFTLTATGGTSGGVAVAVFTDGNPQSVTVKTGQAPNPVTAGSVATYEIRVIYGGNSSSCAVTLSAAANASPAWGAPPVGGFFSFSPSSVTGQGSGSGTDPINPTSVLTVNTTPGMAADTYQFTVSATPAQNCQGNSNPIVSASINLVVAAAAPSNQTITFPAVGPFTFGDGPFTVNASATSGLTVTFATQTPGTCTVAGTSVTIVAAGTCTIRASQAGNGSYNAAPDVDQNITINKANQTITFPAVGPFTFGDPPFEVAATASSGLTVAFSSQSPSACTVVGTTVTIVAAGTCTVRASQAGSANYNPASDVDQNITLSLANQTINFPTVGPYTYGDLPFTVSATASSGLTVTFSSVTPSKCTVLGTSVTIVAAGTCTIRASQVGNASYNPASDVDQNITIAPATLTVTADAKTKVYGDADPALTYVATGFKYSDTDASVLTGALARVAGQNVPGPYAINQGTLVANSNYTISFTGATLTITPAPLSVTADAKTKIYGDADPALTYVSTGFKYSDNAGTVLTGTLARAAGELVQGSPYAISQGTLVANANYTINFTGNSLTITPKPLTISMVSTSRNFGAVTPPALGFSVTYSAFAFSENETVLVGSLVFSPGAATFTNTTNAGVYPISVSGLSSPNYAITYVPGTFTIVDKTAPIVTLSLATPNPAPKGTPIDITARVSDATTGGSPIKNAYYTIDGGSPVNMVTTTGTYNSSVTVDVKATINVPNADVFQVCVYGTDAADNTGTEMMGTQQYCVLVAVYDPDAGFVTGGGWINSPLGAYPLDPALTGKATFGFVAKYKKGQQTPEGNSEFQFHAAGLNFKSTAYEWLVVAGNRAQYKGVGTVNGAAGYGFMLTALDGDLSGNKKPDTFRMKIWRVSDGSIVYDNNIGSSDTGDPTTTLAGGSIVIHSK